MSDFGTIIDYRTGFTIREATAAEWRKTADKLASGDGDSYTGAWLDDAAEGMVSSVWVSGGPEADIYDSDVTALRDEAAASEATPGKSHSANGHSPAITMPPSRAPASSLTPACAPPKTPMPDRPADRHREKPLSLRLGAERQRLEHFARTTGQPVRRVIADAVKAWLDQHSARPGMAVTQSPETTREGDQR